MGGRDEPGFDDRVLDSGQLVLASYPQQSLGIVLIFLLKGLVCIWVQAMIFECQLSRFVWTTSCFTALELSRTLVWNVYNTLENIVSRSMALENQIRRSWRSSVWSLRSRLLLHTSFSPAKEGRESCKADFREFRKDIRLMC